MFRKLDIWKESVALIKDIYLLANKLPKDEEYNLKSQLKRAVVSISLNIAEGKSRASTKDFAHASLYEVEAILVICNELGYIKDIENLMSKTNILNRKINSLRNKLLEDING